MSNPKVLFEITSPSNERFDREDKWREYAKIESLESTIIVSQDKKHITIHARANDWVPVEVTEGQFTVPGLTASLDVDVLYAEIGL